MSDTSSVVVPTVVIDGWLTVDNSYLDADKAPRILIVNCSKLSNDAGLLKYATQAVTV